MRELGIIVLVIYAGMQLSGHQVSSGERDLASQRKPAKTIQCVYKATDLPSEIIGNGSSIHEARSDASQKCFDVRMNFYEMKNPNGAYDMEHGYAVANACTNIRCH